MALENETASSDSTKTSVAGPERMSREAIPAQVAEAAAKKLVPGAELHPAREGGSYKGKVLYADQDFIVQGVGSANKSAVVHQRGDLELVDSNVRWREEHNRLGSTPIQVHYKGEKGVPAETAKVYRWNQEREQADRAMHKAHSYAKNIEDPKERDAFLRNTETMLRQAASPHKDKAAPARSAEQGANMPAPAKSPARDASPDAGEKAAARTPRAKPAKAAEKAPAGPER